jgi:hypothetical protein
MHGSKPSRFVIVANINFHVFGSVTPCLLKLKIKTLWRFETLATTYQSTPRHIPRGRESLATQLKSLKG